MLLAQRILRALFAFEVVVAIAAYAVIAGLMLVDVFLREIIGTSIPGAQRISVYLMILLGFLGIGLAAAKGRHLRPRFADGLVPARFVPLAQRAGACVMCACFLFFGYYGTLFVEQSIEYGDRARNIDLPLWIIQLVVPYAFASIALRYAIFALYPALTPEDVVEG